MSGKNSIQVAIKVRPLLKKDKDQQVFWRVVDNSIQLIDSPSEPCYFDHIFDQDANNQIIFDKMAKQIVHSAIQGFNGTIFAYGQTSSGKTYTMMGDDDNPGVMVLTANEIFREIERTQDRQFLLRVGYIEIYNERIYDLLNKKNQDLKIHETSTGIVSVNCEEMIIRSEDDLLNHLEKGGKERTVGETNMNERSSRSHAIFRIIIESRKIDRSEDDAVIQSVINLVDLAGSERADQTGARGTRLKEGGHINKSLLFLSNVIKRLSESEDDKYVSFRDSKLTRILQASLGGNALTAIICTIKPNAVEETQSTLSFALRAKAIKNKPQVNEIVSDATMMKRLEHEIKVLKTRLEEEQRKNESQLKVRQLEQRIKHEDLKIITCNSLNSVRNREKRRRTWCPSSTNLDAVGQPSSSLPIPSFNSQLSSGAPQPSRLQAPKPSIYNTPLITVRQPLEAPKTICALPVPADDLSEIEEEFAPAELVNFDMLSPLHSPRNKEEQRTISITPKLIGCPRSTLQKVEQDLQELQSFTNLENTVDVQHEPILTLKYKVESLSQRNAELEKERREFLNLKNELELKSESLNATHEKLNILRQRNEELERDVLNLIPLQSELQITTKSLSEIGNRCSELEEQLRKLTDSYKSANEKISKYEAELAELKKTNDKLEMENREAVNLEFEFKRHKYKAKLRESELLEALSEKEKEISKLEKSLNSLSAERLKNSKEELLQKSMIEDGTTDDDGRVCIKCIDLQRLLEENKKVTLEFEKLTLVYENLKLNYEEIERENEASKVKLTNIEEGQQEKEKAECEQLLGEVQQLKTQLHDLQHNYGVLSSENSLKQNECLALTKQIEAARQEMVVLEEKFTKLEVSWQEQQQTIKDIENQYATIQIKYEQLQRQYEQLEARKDQPTTDFQRLEKENFDLQAEIEDLKEKVQDAQQRLLESTNKYEEAAKETQTANEAYSSEASKIQAENEQLRTQLEEIQAKFEALQKEYEDLSNQFIDNLQDCESLRNENLQLKGNLKDCENKYDHFAKAETEINELKSQLEKALASGRKSILSSCCNVSLRSSGVFVEDEEQEHLTDSTEYGELFRKFSELSASVTQIELEDATGNKKLFKSASKNSTPISYKLHLKNISGIHRTPKKLDMEIENIHLQGSCNYSFYIAESIGEDNLLETKNNDVDINGCESITEYTETLKKEILELRSINELEQQNKKSLLENAERALSEMREQITQLSAELLEKSMFVENCACKMYQQEIENLKKEKADVTIICEELQEKMNSTMNCSLQTNITLQGFEDNLKELEKLRQREQELLESYDSQTKTLEEITQRCVDVEAELENVREQLKNQEKQYKESCSQLQLENLQKLELSTNEYRENMKKYNKEWEDKKDEYDRIIEDLNTQINELKQIASRAAIKQEPVPDYEENVADERQPFDMTDVTPNNIPPTDVTTIQSDECRLQEENTDLKLQLNMTEDHLEHVNEENRAKCEEIKLLDSKLLHLEELLTDANAANVTLRRENRVLQTELEDTRRDLDCIPILHEKNQSLCEEIEKLNLEYLCLRTANLNKPDIPNQDFVKKDTPSGKLSKKDKKAKREDKNKLSNDIEGLNQENKQLHDALERAEKLLEKHQQGVCREEFVQTLQSKQERLTLLEQEKECLANDLERLREEYKQVNGKLLNSGQQIEELQNEISMREQLLKTLQSIVDNLSPVEKVNKMPAKDYENLQEKYNQMQDKLIRTEQEIQELKKEAASREELLKTLQVELDRLTSLEEGKKALATYYENLQQEHKQLQDKLVKSENRIQELCTEDSSREVFLQSLQDQLCDMKALEEEKKFFEEEILRLKELQERDVRYEKEIENLKQQVNNLLQNQSETEITWQSEKTERDDRLANITSECNLLRADKSLLETRVSELTEERNSLHEKYSGLQAEKATLEEQLKCLKEKENVQELLDEIIKEKAELVRALSLLTEKLETAQKELQENEKCTSQVKEENQQIQEDLLNLHKDIKDLWQDFEKQSEEKQKLQQKLEETKGELAKLQHEKLEQQLLLKKAKEEEDNLREEMRLLKETISHVAEEKQRLLNNIEINLQKVQNENQELQLQLKNLNDELDKLKGDQKTKTKENTQLQADLLATKDSLTRLQEEHQITQEKHKLCLKLQEEKSKLEATLNVLKKAQTGAFTTLQDEKLQLLKTLQQYEQQNKDFKEKEETFKQKIDSLSQQLHEMRIKSDSYEKLLLEHEETENLLTSQTTLTQTLQQEILQLNSQQASYVSEIDKLNSQLLIQDEEKQTLETKLSRLQETLQDEKRSLQKENDELKGSLEELKLKLNSLKSTNTQLEALNQQLQEQLNSANVKLIASNELQEKLNLLEVQHSQLQQSLKETVEVAGQCSLTLRQDVEHHKALLQKQVEKYNALSTEMTKKQHSLSVENFQLSAIIETLTREKLELEEKLRQAAVKNFELDLQRQAAESSATNVSSDLDASSSPKARIMLERLSNVSLEDKLCSKQQKKSTAEERKNRRLSAHDERRRQSYWGAAHDKETMTDPVDTSCNCLELDRKLKDCERNLFIKNSQVTALSMELKNHPLKEENVALKKRLQEEHDKFHIEIKRCKNKLHEQTIKTEKALAAAAHLTAKSAHAELLSEQKTAAAMKVVADIETQTDDELSACLQKLQGKYNDLKNICRHRYNLIKELEEKVAQKENSNGNSLSSLETVKMANIQNESLKQELAIIKDKYETAKKVLFSRRQEITNLRAQLEQNQ